MHLFPLISPSYISFNIKVVNGKNRTSFSSSNIDIFSISALAVYLLIIFSLFFNMKKTL